MIVLSAYHIYLPVYSQLPVVLLSSCMKSTTLITPDSLNTATRTCCVREGKETYQGKPVARRTCRRTDRQVDRKPSRRAWYWVLPILQKGKRGGGRGWAKFSTRSYIIHFIWVFFLSTLSHIPFPLISSPLCPFFPLFFNHHPVSPSSWGDARLSPREVATTHGYRAHQKPRKKDSVKRQKGQGR